jgi:hypothetical protein
MVDQIRKTADFFLKQGLTGTDDVSMLAKVPLLFHSEREEAKQDSVRYIQSQ